MKTNRSKKTRSGKRPKRPTDVKQDLCLTAEETARWGQAQALKGVALPSGYWRVRLSRLYKYMPFGVKQAQPRVLLLGAPAAAAGKTAAAKFASGPFAAVTAATEREATAALFFHQPQAVVLNLTAAEDWGLNFLAKLRRMRIFRCLPVLLTAGRDLREQELARARKLGVTGFLPLAADPEAFHRELSLLVRRPH